MNSTDELIRTLACPAPIADAIEDSHLEAARLRLESAIAAEPSGTCRPVLRSGRRPTLGLLGAIVSCVVAVAIGAVVLANLRHRPAELHSAGSGQAASALIAKLAVLRRAQTPADRMPAHLKLQDPEAQSGRIIPSLTRLVAIRPGVRIYLVVTTPYRGASQIWSPRFGDQVTVVAITARGDTEGAGYPAADLHDASQLVTAGWLTPSLRFDLRSAYDVAIVPDGVARVRWTFASTAGVAGRVVDVPVTNNVALTPLRLSTYVLSSALWYAPDGGVVPTSATALNRASAAQQAAPVGARQLASELAALRRPQTAADLDSPQIQQYLTTSTRSPLAALTGTPIRSLIRRLASTPFGDVFVVPLGPPSQRAIAQLPAALRARASRYTARLRNVLLFATVTPGGAGCCSDAAGLASYGSASLSQNRGSPALVTILLPDGVAKVTVLLPRQVGPGMRVYPRVLAVSATVHDNVAVLQIDRNIDDVDTGNMIWYGPTGNIVKRITAPRHRIVPAPKPTPPTALSREAQANPATPNPVSVTPEIGGPNTTFTVSFRILLTGGGYLYRISGPGGPGCHGRTPPSTGGGPISGGISDVRGQTFSQQFAPETGALTQTHWCPGLFDVTVAATGVLPHRDRTYPPFGTATFTVRP